MSLPKPCERCGKRFDGRTRWGRYCPKCIRIAFITKMFNKNNKFRGCKTLEEAMSKYGN